MWNLIRFFINLLHSIQAGPRQHSMDKKRVAIYWYKD